MKGLILDTSTHQAIIGISDSERLTKVKVMPSGKNLSSVLFPAIEPFCHRIDYISVGVGPGSYMGVRTGATIAKLLAFSREIPLIDFPSILVSIPKEQKGPFLFVGDAKMGEQFLTSGTVINGRIKNLTPPHLISTGGARHHLQKGQSLINEENETPHLTWALAHTLDALSQKKTTSPEALSLNYLR